MRSSAKTALELDRVLHYCKLWGIPVERSSEIDPPEPFYEGPLFGGIQWSANPVIFFPERVRSLTERKGKLRRGWVPVTSEPQAPLALLHELAHCVVGKTPMDVNEVSSLMLAFEYHSCRNLKLSGWSEWMEDYSVSYAHARNSTYWPHLPTRERGRLLNMSLGDAVYLGVFTERGKPTYKRVIPNV